MLRSRNPCANEGVRRPLTSRVRIGSYLWQHEPRRPTDLQVITDPLVVRLVVHVVIVAKAQPHSSRAARLRLQPTAALAEWHHLAPLRGHHDRLELPAERRIVKARDVGTRALREDGGRGLGAVEAHVRRGIRRVARVDGDRVALAHAHETQPAGGGARPYELHVEIAKGDVGADGREAAAAQALREAQRDAWRPRHSALLAAGQA